MKPGPADLAGPPRGPGGAPVPADTSSQLGVHDLADRSTFSDTSAAPRSADPDPPTPGIPSHVWLVPPIVAARTPEIAPPDALAELDALLARDRLDDAACLRLAALAPRVPGRLRAVVAALAACPAPAALDALLTVPQVPGALEALARAFAGGRTRTFTGPDGRPVAAPVVLALDFRGSRARPFPDLLRRAELLAADPDGAVRLEALRVDGRPHWRLSFWPDELPPRRRAARARALEPDLALLHGRLARLRGARLWLSGFCLPADGPVSPAAQAHLLRAWLAWSRGQAS